MAQRIVHYAFGALLAGGMEKTDRARFLLGSLLPDAYTEKDERDLTHYTIREGNCVWFDFGAFAKEFPREVRVDPLYLGYYLHLVEDDLHRRLIHGTYQNRFTPRSDDELRLLYRDYHILNRRLTDRYGLKDELILPPDFVSLPLNARVPLDAGGMIAELRADLADTEPGDPVWITEEMMAAFIAESLPVLEKETAAALRGETTLSARDFAWERHARYN